MNIKEQERLWGGGVLSPSEGMVASILAGGGQGIFREEICVQKKANWHQGDSAYVSRWPEGWASALGCSFCWRGGPGWAVGPLSWGLGERGSTETEHPLCGCGSEYGA